MQRNATQHVRDAPQRNAQRLGLTDADLRRLSVVHVAGTKGKVWGGGGGGGEVTKRAGG